MRTQVKHKLVTAIAVCTLLCGANTLLPHASVTYANTPANQTLLQTQVRALHAAMNQLIASGYAQYHDLANQVSFMRFSEMVTDQFANKTEADIVDITKDMINSGFIRRNGLIVTNISSVDEALNYVHDDLKEYPNALAHARQETLKMIDTDATASDTLKTLFRQKVAQETHLGTLNQIELDFVAAVQTERLSTYRTNALQQLDALSALVDIQTYRNQIEQATDAGAIDAVVSAAIAQNTREQIAKDLEAYKKQHVETINSLPVIGTGRAAERESYIEQINQQTTKQDVDAVMASLGVHLHKDLRAALDGYVQQRTRVDALAALPSSETLYAQHVAIYEKLRAFGDAQLAEAFTYTAETDVRALSERYAAYRFSLIPVLQIERMAREGEKWRQLYPNNQSLHAQLAAVVNTDYQTHLLTPTIDEAIAKNNQRAFETLSVHVQNLEKTPVTVTDTRHNVVISGPTSALQNVKGVSVDSVTVNALEGHLNRTYVAFDITLLNASGTAVQPQGPVEVIIPASAFPASFNKVVQVFYVEGDTLHELPFTVDPHGAVRFTTTHFSTYAVVLEKHGEGKILPRGKDGFGKIGTRNDADGARTPLASLPKVDMHITPTHAPVSLPVITHLPSTGTNHIPWQTILGWFLILCVSGTYFIKKGLTIK